MKIFNISGSIAAIIVAGALLGACDDGGNKNRNSSSHNSKNAQSQKQEPFVWPGKDTKIAVADSLTATNYMIVYDGSGSMGDPAPKCGIRDSSKHQEGLNAVKTFVKAIPDDANIGLYVFDSRSWSVRVDLAANTKGKVLAGLDAVRPGEGTPLGQAVAESYKVLTKQAQRQLGYGRYSMVIVTDGEAGDAKRLADNINYIVKNSPIEIHAIGFCIGEGHTLNQQGKTFYASAKSPADLLKGLQGVLAETDAADVEFSQ